MNLSKSTSYTLVHILNGCTTAAQVSAQLHNTDIRSIQRALSRLTDLGMLIKTGVNSPTYTVNYSSLLQATIPEKLLQDMNRPSSKLNSQLIQWLIASPQGQVDSLLDYSDPKDATASQKMSAKDIEHLTVELSWKSSSFEGNTYTLLDTQLLLVEGIKAKNRTEFETQMILNHKDAVAFIVDNPDLFSSNIAYSSVEQIHRIIGQNLGIKSGIRKKIVNITASNYLPLSDPHKLKENMLDVLAVINHAQTPFVRALLALSLVPYLQAFEDGNKRTGRMLANAILISSTNKGFSLRNTDARQLALAYLSFYEFNSMQALSKILKAELS